MLYCDEASQNESAAAAVAAAAAAVGLSALLTVLIHNRDLSFQKKKLDLADLNSHRIIMR